MTELTPVGTVGGVKPGLQHLSKEAKLGLKLKQGRPHVLVDMRIVDDNGTVSGTAAGPRS
jgi:hypothetical protein